MNKAPNMDDIRQLRAMAKRMRLDALQMAHASGERGAHISGSLSCIEIYASLYGRVLRLDRADWDNRDRFIAGKEHARLAEYPAMAEAGLIAKEQLIIFEQDGGPLAGHPQNTSIGLEYSSCSLGMALSYAVGKALYAKANNSRYHVYCLIGDGECHEGSVWEAVMAAAHYKLENLTVIVDRNHMSVDGHTSEVLTLGNMSDKFRAFGWHTVTADGHDFSSLLAAFAAPHPGQPMAIVAETIKGKGVSFMENQKHWHHAALNNEQYSAAYAEVSGEEI